MSLRANVGLGFSTYLTIHPRLYAVKPVTWMRDKAMDVLTEALFTKLQANLA